MKIYKVFIFRSVGCCEELWIEEDVKYYLDENLANNDFQTRENAGPDGENRLEFVHTED